MKTVILTVREREGLRLARDLMPPVVFAPDPGETDESKILKALTKAAQGAAAIEDGHHPHHPPRLGD